MQRLAAHSTMPIRDAGGGFRLGDLTLTCTSGTQSRGITVFGALPWAGGNPFDRRHHVEGAANRARRGYAGARQRAGPCLSPPPLQVCVEKPLRCGKRRCESAFWTRPFKGRIHVGCPYCQDKAAARFPCVGKPAPPCRRIWKFHWLRGPSRPAAG